MIDLILAAPGLRQEPELITAAPSCGIRVLRRCVDAVDLVAAAAIDPTLHVVLSADLPRLSADVTARLGARRRIVGLALDPLDATALEGLGIGLVVPVDGVAAGTWRDVRDALLGGSGAGQHAAPSGVWTTGVWSDATSVKVPDESVARPDGSLIAVWGPMGAPGRTTVAIGVAEAMAKAGRRVCLVDSDTYAPSIGLALGLSADSGGLVRVCRQADNGLLDASSLLASTARVRGTWHVLTGVPRAERWSELSPSALDRVWQSAREAFDVTVVDIGFCIEDDDSPAAWARRRNAAAVTALAAADRVLAVADASGLGAARLVSAWPALSTATAASSATIVRNRSGGHHAREWNEALEQFAVRARVHSLPADAKSVAACWSRGRSLGERARRSPLQKSLNGLARDLMSG